MSDRVPDDIRDAIIKKTLGTRLPGGMPGADRKEVKEQRREASPSRGSQGIMDEIHGESLGGLLETTLEERREKDEARLREDREARAAIIETTDPSMVHGIMDSLLRR